MPDSCTTIAAAIRRRRLLSFSYGGHRRVVEPHIIGTDGKGHMALSAYQVRGGSESGTGVGWKLFHVDELHRVMLLQETFAGPRPDYNRGDKVFASVRAQL